MIKINKILDYCEKNCKKYYQCDRVAEFQDKLKEAEKNVERMYTVLKHCKMNHDEVIEQNIRLYNELNERFK